MKKFLQHICTLAVCVGVLGYGVEAEALQERVKQALETLEAIEEQLKFDLEKLSNIMRRQTLAPEKAKLNGVQEIKSTLEAVRDELPSVWKNRGGGFLAGTIFGGVGTLAGKYLLDDLNADAPTGSEDAGEGEISQDDLTISSGAVGVSSTM
eukprot:933873_1